MNDEEVGIGSLVFGPILDVNEAAQELKTSPEQFEQWLDSARVVQTTLVMESNHAVWHEYSDDDESLLLQRICLTLYGIRENEEIDPIAPYSLQERIEAIKIRTALLDYTRSENIRQIQLNSVFIVVFYARGNDLVLCKVPVFRLRGADAVRFLTCDGSFLDSVDDVINESTLPFNGGVLYPTDLSYEVDQLHQAVVLEYRLSSGASNTLRTINAITQILMISSIVISGGILTLPTTVAKRSMMVAAFLAVASFATPYIANSGATLLAARQFNVVNILDDLCERMRDPDARSEIVAAFRRTLETFARRSGADINGNVSVDIFFTTLEPLYMLYDLRNNENRTYSDYYAVIMRLFGLHNQLLTREQVNDLLDAEPMQFIQEMMERQIQPDAPPEAF